MASSIVKIDWPSFDNIGLNQLYLLDLPEVSRPDITCKVFNTSVCTIYIKRFWVGWGSGLNQLYLLDLPKVSRPDITCKVFNTLVCTI